MDGQNSDTFKKRSGCTDRGKDYEHLYLALLVLRLTTDKKIKDFRLSSNAENYGAFDDVILEVERSNGSRQIYAVQLKHKGRSLTTAALTGNSGDFSLRKYHAEFTKLKKLPHPGKFILLTNLRFGASDQTKLTLEDACEVTLVREPQDDVLKTCDGGRCWRFTTSDKKYEDFFNSFFLYTEQESVDKLKSATMTEFRQLFASNDEIFEQYLNFVTGWSLQERRKDKLNKDMMLNVIILKVLGPQVMSLSFSGDSVDDRTVVFREAVLKFRVTCLDEDCYEYVKKIWHDMKTTDVKVLNQVNEKYQVAPGYIQKLDDLGDKDYTKLLWLMGLCPLPVLACETFEKIILLCQNRFIVFGNSRSAEGTFRKLSHLDSATYGNVVKRFTCSLQGRPPVTLEDLIETNPKIAAILSTNELFRMLGSFEIGGPKEILPIPHIHRILSRNILSLDFLGRTKSLVFVGRVREEDEQQIRNASLDKAVITRIADFWKRKVDTEDKDKEDSCKIFIDDKECPDDEVATICRQLNRRDYHHFRMSEEGLEWVRSNRIGELKDFRTVGQWVDQGDVFGKPPENRINVVCADPGMGKSILMKCLKNSLSVWTILVQPKDHSKYFRTKIIDSGDFFQYILTKMYSGFTSELVKILFEGRQVVFIWDGLDEAAEDNLRVILQVIQNLANERHVQWLTSRCNLKNTLEATFNVLARNIEQFDLEQQNVYIEKRLNCTGGDLEDIKKKIFNCIRLVQYNDILGIPLQIYMFTELFRRDARKYRDLLSSVFSITDLYRHFVDEKFNIYHGVKAELSDSNDMVRQVMERSKNERLKQYEEAALTIHLRPDLLTRLRINCDLFLEEVQAGCDGVGIIVGVTDEKIASFLHNSYGEYFSACYLCKNHTKIPGFVDFIFDASYNNIRFLFDLLMAEECPAHVAALYKNVAVLETHEDALTLRDRGGRSPLHLACSWGRRFSFGKVDDEAAEDAPEYKEILGYLSRRCDPMEVDTLFQMDCFSYADRACCLLPILVLSSGRRFDFGTLTNFNDVCKLLYNAVRFDYSDVFEDIPFVTIEDDTSLLHLSITHGSVNCLRKMLANPEYRERINAKDGKGVVPILHACYSGHLDVIQAVVAAGGDLSATTSSGYTGIYILARSKHTAILKTLLDSGWDVDVRNDRGQTSLHVACDEGAFSVAALLIDLGADVNLGDRFGYTPLYLACRHKNGAIVDLLIENGADVNRANHHGDLPLFMAAWNGQVETVRLLLAKGAEIDGVNARGHGAVHAACMKGHEEVLGALIAAGVDVNAPNKFGQSPLFLAVKQQKEFRAGLRMLLANGADVEAVNGYGENFWDVGRRCYDTQQLIGEIVAAKGAAYWEWMRERLDIREAQLQAGMRSKTDCNVL